MYPNMNNYEALYRQMEMLVSNIEKAINGEYSAVQCYDQLAKLASRPDEKQQIQEIRADEQKHLESFLQIYTSLTGRQYQPKITEECPSVYKEGVELAFRDEQETVDFYLDIADQANNQFIKETFRRASADEQNHAVWFLYFLSKMPK
jgi:rubrerythrin